MNEEAATQDHLVAYLEADTELMGMLGGGVVTRAVPQSWAFPVVKIDREDSEDLRAFGTRVWCDMTFLVQGAVHWQGAGRPDWTVARAISDRVDTLLHGYQATSNGVALEVWREESFTDETDVGTDLYLQAGGLYRVRARDAG